MAFTVDQLLLTDEREAQLTEALANTGVTDPLTKCISEAAADVARLTAGFVIDQESLDGWTRTIATWKAFVAASIPLPDDIQKACDAAMKELTEIAQGKRPNLPRVPAATSPSAGGWGSRKHISPGNCQ